MGFTLSYFKPLPHISGGKRDIKGEKFSGTPNFVLAKKLKVLKEDIIQWNRSEFGNVERQKKELLEALKLLDVKEGEHGLFEVELGERAMLRSQI